MKPAEVYQHLRVLFDYPQDKAALQTAATVLARCLAANGLEAVAAPFAAYISASTLGELQEEYVRTFDFNPLCAPYLSHHLYGDNNRKGDFMISLKALYRQHGFTPRSCELPDHVAILFDFAAYLSAAGDAVSRLRLVATYVTEGLDKMKSAAAAKDDLQWRHPIIAAAALCAVDCQEVHHA